MGNIRVLSFEIANLIAAGEVVERPSSVLKELLENAIDAGATRIVAEIKRGGVALIRVTDNGCGISREDLPVAIKRHATSKIREAADLDHIATLGFRGEALAAIASVSRLTMITKTAEAESASMLTSEGGEIVEITDVGASDGTTVVVEDLFFNVPARRKFLKKDATEAMNVAVLVEKVALSRPDISIQLLIDGEERFRTPGDGVAENTVYAVLGRDFAAKMLPVDGEIGHIHVRGFIGRSDNVRRNRNYENVFINGRYVKSLTVQAAVEKAFTSYIAPECFPTCVLFVDMPPQVVDVNVHPAKLEVKFSDERAVFEAVYYTVRSKLEQSAYRPEMTLGERKPYTPIFRAEGGDQLQMQTPVSAPSACPTPVSREHDSVPVRDAGRSATPRELHRPMIDAVYTAAPRTGAPSREAIPSVEQSVHHLSPSASIDVLRTLRSPEPHLDAPSSAPTYRYVGEAFDCYVMIEYEGALLIIDKHAAHERVLFEQLRAGLKRDPRSFSQELLLPIRVPLSADTLALVAEHTAELVSVGFTVTVDSDGVSLHTIPSLLDLREAEALFVQMADELTEGKGTPALSEDMRRERALYQIACKGAIKGGRSYDRSVIDWLITELLSLPDLTVCPHGRPIAYKLTKTELDKQFDRIK